MNQGSICPEVEFDREEIIEHLNLVLADRRFASAERNARFLRYVVEAVLDGRAHQVKETVIATEVYGRATGYDPKADSIVRVEASRLRQKLRGFYENEGRHCAIRIHLPSGGYVPSFERAAPAPEVQTVAPGLEIPPSRAWAALACLAAGILAFGLYLSRAAASSDAEAMAAWREGVALMDLDPHSAQTAGGPPKTLLRAIERLEYSTVRDPFRAQAWATLAEAYDYASGFVGRDLGEDERRASAAAERAIQLDPKLSAGHQMLGLMQKSVRWNFKRAEAAYREALRLDPRNGYAVVEYADLLWETGRTAKAIEEVRRARALLPAFPALAVKEAELQLFLGRPDAALSAAESALEMSASYTRAQVAAGMAHEWKGDTARALELYRLALRADPNDRRALPAYGYLLGRTGRTEEARAVATRLERINTTVRNCAFQVAVVYAGLGEDDRALDWLETAYRTRQAHFPFAAAEYRFRKYHQTHRFLETLSRIGQRPVTAEQGYVTLSNSRS